MRGWRDLGWGGGVREGGPEISDNTHMLDSGHAQMFLHEKNKTKKE